MMLNRDLDMSDYEWHWGYAVWRTGYINGRKVTIIMQWVMQRKVSIRYGGWDWEFKDENPNCKLVDGRPRAIGTGRVLVCDQR